jgi:hypothetical protein
MKTLAVAALVTGAATAAMPAKADNCEAMLKPYVDWSSKQAGDSKHTYPVFVTISTHYAGGGKVGGTATGDPVVIEFGEANVQVAKAPAVLAGLSLPMRTPKSNWAVNPKATADFSITSAGVVSYVEKLNGKPIGGMPPISFNGVCSNGLVTGVSGAKSWAISFFNGPSLTIVQ